MLCVVAQQARADAMDWLVKINRAGADLSFSGIFIYAQNGQIDTMQVSRRITDGALEERLYALNGEAREIVRDENLIWCYFPNQNVGVHEHRQTLDSGFPRILPDDLERLKQHYRFREGEVSRIADRLTQRIDVMPTDDYRYGYRLWADVDTGLLLRSDLLDGDEQLIEQYQFVDIDFGDDISDRELKATTGKENLRWYGTDTRQPSASRTDLKWHFSDLPAGYRLSKYFRRMMPMEEREIEHLIFTDGLATVSVFIQPANATQSEMRGLGRMGAVHVYRSTRDDHHITVMGEAPARTVEMLVAGMNFRG